MAVMHARYPAPSEMLRTARIVHNGTPKPREECTPFTFALDTTRPDVRAQEKFVKGLEKLRRAEARAAKAKARA